MNRTLFISSLLLSSLPVLGCFQLHASLSTLPSAIHRKEICPGVQYEVVDEFKKTWRGFGILGTPVKGPPDVASHVSAEVGRLKGDAAVDVKLRTDFRAIIYAFVLPDVYPRYELSGKVIRYTTGSCETEAAS